ncbi:MAG: pyruvate kinase, partial [Chloroflexota bacterium]|nr:pyruvate kinase [Chloroflexota bacterium]
SKLAPDPVTEKDLEILSFGLEQGVDIFGISFVEKADDIRKIKDFALQKGKSIWVVAKIERAEAVKNIDSILEAADAIMIARGDLGVQVPMQDVPMIQKKLIRKANLRGRPVITATQMLESMVDNVRPTRAEATDVANAILDGTDAVMLSEETAIGKYPVEAVKIMSKIALSVERQRGALRLSSDVEAYSRHGDRRKRISVEEAVSLSVVDALRALRIRFVLVPTLGGSTPRRISRFKPDCWVLAFCNSETTCGFLTFSYGVAPVLLKEEVDNWHYRMLRFMRDSRLTKIGDKVILAEGMSVGQFDGADSMRIVTID